MIGCLQICVCKQPIIALYFGSENDSSFITSRPGPVLTILMLLTFFPKFLVSAGRLVPLWISACILHISLFELPLFSFFLFIMWPCQCQQKYISIQFYRNAFFCFWYRTYQGFQPLSLIHRCLWLVLISEPR